MHNGNTCNMEEVFTNISIYKKYFQVHTRTEYLDEIK